MSDIEVFHDIIDVVIGDNEATVDVVAVSGTPDIDVIDVATALTPGIDVIDVVTVMPGPPGPPGPAGGTYRHVQTVPAAVWTVVHGLNFPPNVTVVNSAHEVVIAGTTEYVDATTIRLTFSAEVAGEAYLS